jgi:hypothetical protein
MRTLIGDQPRAFEEVKIFVDGQPGLHLLHGYAGTGKTFLMGEINQYCQMKGISTLVTAPTHKAVKVLKQKMQQNADYATTHAALGMKESIDDHGVLTFKADPMMGYPAEKYDLLVIDEASMVADVIFDTVVDLMDRGKKILFVGDPYQIPPVNHIYAKPFLRKVQAEYNIGVSAMKEIIRQAQGNPIIANAWDIRTRIEESRLILKRGEVKNEVGEVSHVPMEKQDIFQDKILDMYKSREYWEDIDFVKVIAWRNDTVNMYNGMIREHIFGEGLPKIIKGDRLVADAPIVETGPQGKIIQISTNEEMEVLDLSLEVDVLGEDYFIKYYKTHVRVIGRPDVFNEYMIRIIHEESEHTYKKLCEMQIALAKSYQPGSYQAKAAWMDYYGFIEHWHRVKYSYCITAHKSQGSTYNTAYVLEWDILANRDVFERNRIMYTACTRPSNNLYIEY